MTVFTKLTLGLHLVESVDLELNGSNFVEIISVEGFLNQKSELIYDPFFIGNQFGVLIESSSFSANTI